MWDQFIDRSIDGLDVFIQTNVVGTTSLLTQAHSYWNSLSGPEKESFRFIHVSTDEVFGSLGQEGLFSEVSPYEPNSPYAASKAASDHFVGAWHKTYGLPSIITNCSNNYGPYHLPEKLIPLTILNALENRLIPIYGDGRQIRDWMHVNGHVIGLVKAFTDGVPGQTYCFGGNMERTNMEVVDSICEAVDRIALGREPAKSLIRLVEDRPGHDRRYAMDISKVQRDLNWSPSFDFNTGLEKTVDWYVSNRDWWEPLLDFAQKRVGRGRSSA